MHIAQGLRALDSIDKQLLFPDLDSVKASEISKRASLLMWLPDGAPESAPGIKHSLHPAKHR